MPTSPYVPKSALPNIPTRTIERAIEGAVIGVIADDHLEEIGNIHRSGLIPTDRLRDAFVHWGLLPLFTAAYPQDLMRNLYANWLAFHTTRGTLYSLDLFAEAVETTYALQWTANANGRRVSVIIEVHPFAAGAVNPEQQLYLLRAYRWLLATQAAVTSIRIIERSNMPVYAAFVSQGMNVSFSPGVSP